MENDASIWEIVHVSQQKEPKSQWLKNFKETVIFRIPSGSLRSPHSSVFDSPRVSPPPVGLRGRADDWWWIEMSIWNRRLSSICYSEACRLHLSLTLLHPSGRRHPDCVNNGDSNRLYWGSGPTSEGKMRLTWGGEGYLKTEEQKKWYRDLAKPSVRGRKAVWLDTLKSETHCWLLTFKGICFP